MEAAAIQAPARAAPDPSEGVAGLAPGTPLRGRFAVVRKDRQQSKAGTPYLSLELRDRTGSIPARIFRDADALGARFERGDAIEARGRVERFRGNLSAELTAVRRIEPGSFDPGEFLPSAYRSVEELEGFFEHLLREVHDPGLRAVVEAVVAEPRTATELRRAPCTRAGHHAYLGGLLEHTVAVGTLVGEVCQLHPRLDSDLLMAAALLHDVGKTQGVRPRGGVRDQRGGGDARPPGDRRRADRRPTRAGSPRRGAWRCCTACSAITAPRPRGASAATGPGSAPPRRSRWPA